ncbi:MAG: hypothetical protein K0V04_38755, partial [Deltaproteobacteria bacterium]|nr:hypothetical protein [Deltaproteobacteria bacterium]
MANTPDIDGCCEDRSTTTLPLDPFCSLNVHFGMLLGVEDYRTVDAYHRGKTWMHSAWLHGAGVVWGYGVGLDEDSGELRIEPGLALDAAGRELHLDHPACLTLARWYEVHRDDPELEVTALGDGEIAFSAHVRIRFVACPSRKVPAMLESCEGAGTTTAHSRLCETVELELCPGLPEPIPPAYHRLRLLFELDEPRTDPEGEIVAADQHVLEIREQLKTVSPDKRAFSVQTAFRSLAALDAAELGPATGDSEGSGILPALDPAWLTIAVLTSITLRPKDDGWVLEDGLVDIRTRLTHVATRPLQDLIAASMMQPSSASGPQLVRSSLIVQGNKIEILSTAPLDPKSLEGAISLRVFDANADADSGWTKPDDISFGATLEDGGTRLVITAEGMPEGDRLRLWIAGTGPTPVLGVDGLPLAGADDDHAVGPHTGH